MTTLSPVELNAARVLAQCLIHAALQAGEVKRVAINPTMRPDPQAAIATHGTLMSHANA